jgi:hypothetical protein
MSSVVSGIRKCSIEQSRLQNQNQKNQTNPPELWVSLCSPPELWVSCSPRRHYIYNLKYNDN